MCHVSSSYFLARDKKSLDSFRPPPPIKTKELNNLGLLFNIGQYELDNFPPAKTNINK